MKIVIKFDKQAILKIAENRKKNIEKVIQESIDETEAQANNLIQQGYNQSQLRVLSGFLYNSFRTSKTATSMRIYSTVVYSRIQDLGGWAGRNHASYIPPTFYFTNGTKKLREYFILKLKSKLRK